MLKILVYPLCALLLVGWAAELRAEPLQLAPREGVLLLRTGSVVRGKISRAGDRYYVALPHAELRIKVENVELFCRNLDEAYRMKSSAIKPGQVDARLELAEWCLRNNLLGYAAHEVLRARRDNPRHPRLELVQRRLELAANPPDIPFTADTDSQPRPSGEQLSQWVRGLPPGTVENFTNTVQPLLLNRCATGGCHGPAAENRLRLERIPGGRPPTRSITHRNLKAVLECVDREDPAASLLLTRPLAPHGEATEAIFNGHDLRQYQQLVKWVHEMAQPRQPPQPPNVERTAAPLLQTMDPARLPRQTRMSGEAPPFPEIPASTSSKTLPDATLPEIKLDEPAEIVPEHKVQYGAPPAEPKAKDPFDPALFNRRFAK
jgi:hypothetical protein